ncbi:MAG TPA: hypothetical protein VG268_00755 [Streptosporangiaceae bacterium]|jgi:hypothetical protein|nr:hypothetical protein [Streptosporangiaceae bacterium]
MDTTGAVEELSTIARTSGLSDLANQVAANEGRVEIGRYAARLAAFERIVLPAAERRLDDGKAQAEQVREGGQQLTTVLYWLDRHLTGDVRAATWPGDDLSHDVRAAAATYAEMEHGLIGELPGGLRYRLAGLVDDVRDGTESRPAGPVVQSDAAQSLRELGEDATTDARPDAVAGKGDHAEDPAPKQAPAEF